MENNETNVEFDQFKKITIESIKNNYPDISEQDILAFCERCKVELGFKK